MQYLNPFESHGLKKPFMIPGCESQSTEPVADDVEEIRKELINYEESACPACDLGGCMIKGVGVKDAST
jgi:hypothetical protein